MDEINWKTYGVDAESAAFWDKYNAAVKNAVEREKEASPKLESDKIRKYCNDFRIFYADLIGEENAKAVLSDVPDNKRCFDAVYASLLRCIHDQKAEANRRIAGILLKYAPKTRGNGNAAPTV
ncbi:DUF6673 family protein [Ruminococcus sp.]|uniref:DUF6673 family protein n=1 Tax=Ruminococcus sp. TaxID=41978 RepID=UPI0025E47947|nr:DUF6673 family protein [Ruminococcus sp.]